MTRTEIVILTLSVTVVLAPPAMAKTVASISPPMQVCSGFDVSSEDYNPSLVAADLFKIGTLLEIACFDAPPPGYIEIGWLSLVNGLFLLTLHHLEVGCYEMLTLLPDSGYRLVFGQ
jgi:hypothetical protein